MGKTRQLDVFGYALNAERDEMNFYLKTSRMLKTSKEFKKLFIKLAKEEAKHLETFIGLRAQTEGMTFDQCFHAQEINDYLESVIKEGLFPRGENIARRLENVDSVAAACAMAMQTEKSAILLYTELARLDKDKERKNILGKLAQEEKNHLVMLGALRADSDPRYAALRLGRFF